MRYIKYKSKTKDRCQEAIANLRHDPSFEYLMENMFAESLSRAEADLRETPVNEIEYQPIQGAARFIKEFMDLSKEPRDVIGPR